MVPFHYGNKKHDSGGGTSCLQRVSLYVEPQMQKWKGEWQLNQEGVYQPGQVAHGDTISGGFVSSPSVKWKSISCTFSALSFLFHVTWTSYWKYINFITLVLFLCACQKSSTNLHFIAQKRFEFLIPHLFHST